LELSLKRENIRCSLATAIEIAKHDEINCIYFSLSKEKRELPAMLNEKQRADIDFIHIVDTPGLDVKMFLKNLWNSWRLMTGVFFV